MFRRLMPVALAASLLCALQFTAEAQQRSRTPERGDVPRLASLVVADADTLYGESQRIRYEDPRLREDVNRRLDDLRKQARNFYAEVGERRHSPGRAEREFGELSQAYEGTLRVLPPMRYYSPVRATRERLQNSMAALTDFYSNSRDYSLDDLRRLAHDTYLAADRALDQARDERLHEYYLFVQPERDREMERLSSLRDETREFDKIVQRRDPAYPAIAKGFNDIKEKLDKADNRISIFNRPTEDAFRKLERLVEELQRAVETVCRVRYAPSVAQPQVVPPRPLQPQLAR